VAKVTHPGCTSSLRIWRERAFPRGLFGATATTWRDSCVGTDSSDWKGSPLTTSSVTNSFWKLETGCDRRASFASCKHFAVSVAGLISTATMARESPDIPNSMRKVYRRFERWRGAHTGRLPIPKGLWAAAVELARQHGVFPTAKVLRLEYGKLKQLVEAAGPVARNRGAKAPAAPRAADVC